MARKILALCLELGQTRKSYILIIFCAILLFLMIDLKHKILATLAYYDVLDMPLTSAEIFGRLINFKHLQGPGVRVQVSGKTSLESDSDWNLKPETCTLAKIQKELDQLVIDRIAGRTGEYYFLFDRGYLAPLRLKHEKIAKQKWLRAQRAIRWLRLLPYVETVFASGSLAINNTDELSDLDVLIVAKHGRIWLARFLILGILSLTRMRRRGTDRIAPDKICPNHFITDGSLQIPFHSLYNAQTYSNLVPIYSRQLDMPDKFKKANDWISSFVFNWNVPAKPLMRTGFLELAVKPAEWLLNTRFGNALENWARRFQSKKIVRNPATKQTGGRVMFTDQQLEFHPRSIEASIIKKYNSNLIKLGMPDLAVEHDSGLIK